MVVLRFMPKIFCFIFAILLIIFAIGLFKTHNVDLGRLRDAIKFSGLSSIREIRKTFSQYYKANNQLPRSSNWCNALIEYYEENGRPKTHIFQIPQLPDNECHFAFNRNLSLLLKEDLPGNLVLVFEADGALNLSGGSELLEQERAKDKYFSKTERYIYILFVDGTIAKYRLSDGSIALAKEDLYKTSNDSSFYYTYEEKKVFSKYHKKGETPYSPLRWK